LAAPRVKAAAPATFSRLAAADSLPGGCWGRSRPRQAPGWSRW
jgi:hypothetical protein